MSGVPDVPLSEPAGVLLLGVALAGLGALRRRKRGWRGERLSDERSLELIERARQRAARQRG